MQCALVLLQLSQYISTHGDISPIFWCKNQCLTKVAFSLLELVCLAVDKAAGVVGTRLEGIAFDSIIAVELRTQIITQLDLGNSTQEVWLGEVGLEFDDLVEILDAEHIVVEIQGVAANRGDAVGVELRLCGTNIKAPSSQSD